MSHWYKTDGSTAYTVKSAKGTDRPTTLADARKHDYWPSVTNLFQLIASPALDNYRQNQLLNAVWNNILDVGRCSKADFSKKVIEESREHSKKAAERGSKIHDAIENALLGKELEDDMKDICVPVLEFLKHEFPKATWEPERSFCSRLGFGGKVDLSDRYGIILDFKTKDTDDVKKMTSYDNHCMQTAAYAVGLDMPGADRYNLFISTQVPGLLKLEKHDNFAKDWGMFEALLKFWQLSTGHKPKNTLGDFNV